MSRPSSRTSASLPDITERAEARLQDEITLLPEQIRAMISAKVGAVRESFTADLLAAEGHLDALRELAKVVKTTRVAIAMVEGAKNPPHRDIAALFGELLKGARQTVSDLHEVRRERDEWRNAAQRDPGLPLLFNKRYGLQHGTELLRSGTPLGVLMMDIDNFKRVNDKLGHKNADVTLDKLAKIINEECRATDIPFRYGGDEFVILCPHTSEEGMMELAKRIATKFAEEEFNFEEKEAMKVKISVGITVADPARGDVIQEKRAEQGTDEPEEASGRNAIDTADKGLYVSKRHGKNRIVLMDESDNPTRVHDYLTGEDEDPDESAGASPSVPTTPTLRRAAARAYRENGGYLSATRPGQHVETTA